VRLFSSIYDKLYRARRRLATGSIAVVVLMLGFHVLFGQNGFVAYQKKRAEYKALDAEIQRLQEENKHVNEQIKALRSDPRAIEKEAREQLKYARPGEVVYTMPQQKPPPQAAPATAQNR
jgi:cell division protein FtsB